MIHHTFRQKHQEQLSDWSTDVLVIENEIVYIHFAVHGFIKVYSVDLMPVGKADSRGIYAAITSAVCTAQPNAAQQQKQTVILASLSLSLTVLLPTYF